jgi:hypothetical protein
VQSLVEEGWARCAASMSLSEEKLKGWDENLGGVEHAFADC